MAQAADQLGQIAEACHRSDLTFGLEVEPNLVGENGHLLAELHAQVNHPAMVLVFDAANIVVQGYTPDEVLEQFRAMTPGMGWMHIKDYHHPKPVVRGEPIDEDMLSNFVPADQGDSAHEQLLREFRRVLPEAGAEAPPPRHSRACSSTWSRTSRAAASSAASAAPTAWASPCAASAACWTTSASTTTSATSTTSRPRGGFRTRGQAREEREGRNGVGY